MVLLMGILFVGLVLPLIPVFLFLLLWIYAYMYVAICHCLSPEHTSQCHYCGSDLPELSGDKCHACNAPYSDMSAAVGARGG